MASPHSIFCSSPSSASGGQIRRLALALALPPHPPVTSSTHGSSTSHSSRDDSWAQRVGGRCWPECPSAGGEAWGRSSIMLGPAPIRMHVRGLDHLHFESIATQRIEFMNNSKSTNQQCSSWQLVTANLTVRQAHHADSCSVGSCADQASITALSSNFEMKHINSFLVTYKI